MESLPDPSHTRSMVIHKPAGCLASIPCSLQTTMAPPFSTGLCCSPHFRPRLAYAFGGYVSGTRSAFLRTRVTLWGTSEQTHLERVSCANDSSRPWVDCSLFHLW